MPIAWCCAWHRTLRVRTPRAAGRLGTRRASLVTFLVARGVLTSDFAFDWTQGAGFLAVTSSLAAMRACSEAPTAWLSTFAMVGGVGFSALVTWALASMTARQKLATRRQAIVFFRENVDVAWNHDRVPALLQSLCSRYHAQNL